MTPPLGPTTPERQQVEQWRRWYFDSLDYILTRIRQEVDALGKNPFQNAQRLELWEQARIERTIGALHLCCRAMPAMDAPSECCMPNEVALLEQLSAHLNDYAQASKLVYLPVDDHILGRVRDLHTVALIDRALVHGEEPPF